VNDGQIVDKLSLGVLSNYTISINEELEISPIPEGTQVFVDEIFLGIVDDGILNITFPDPTNYKLDLRPPHPWMPVICNIEVIL
jgi:hypothetical protein